MAPKSTVNLEEFDDEVVAAPNQGVAEGTAQIESAHAFPIALGGFKDFCLKPELTRAIADNGFEHPSEVQHKALPQALLGNDILAQAKSGMGKTAVFVFALLEHIDKVPEDQPKHVQALVLVHTRELAYQIDREFSRFNRQLPHCTTCVVFGGTPVEESAKFFRVPKSVPLIVVGTPGRTLLLLRSNVMDLSHVKYFVLDEFDQCLRDTYMRKDVQDIFLKTPKEKQVMMFSATMNEEMRELARKFLKSPLEIYVDQQSKLTLHGLVQYYATLNEDQKTRKLIDILDAVDFHQCIIFVNTVTRCETLNNLLVQCKFPSVAVHSRMEQPQRLAVFEQCKSQKAKILISTDLFGRGIDINRINLVIQYDMATDADSYLHRVGRAGRFGNKGLTICFIAPDARSVRSINEGKAFHDSDVLNEVQSRFEIHMQEVPALDSIDRKMYMN